MPVFDYDEYDIFDDLSCNYGSPQFYTVARQKIDCLLDEIDTLAEHNEDGRNNKKIDKLIHIFNSYSDSYCNVLSWYDSKDSSISEFIDVVNMLSQKELERSIEYYTDRMEEAMNELDKLGRPSDDPMLAGMREASAPEMIEAYREALDGCDRKLKMLQVIKTAKFE